jgi:hypothetical protein
MSMTERRPLVDKVRAYLMALPDGARGTLLGALERSGDQAKADPAIALLLEASRGLMPLVPKTEPTVEPPAAVVAEAPKPAPPKPEARRPEPAKPAAAGRPAVPLVPATSEDGHRLDGASFAMWPDRLRTAAFQPLEPYLIDIDLPERRAARIHRRLLLPLWTWLIRDAIPEEMNRALSMGAADPGRDVAGVAIHLRADIVKGVRSVLSGLDRQGKGTQRLAAQLGGDDPISDLGDLMHILENKQVYDAAFQRFPKTVTMYDANETGPVADALRACVADSKINLAFLGTGLLKRLTSPTVLVALVLRMTGTDDARLIAQSPLSPFLDVFFVELDILVETLRAAAKLPNAADRFVEGLRAYHECVRYITIALDIDAVPTFAKRLSASRRAISELVAAEIETAPGHMRRALRVGADRGGRFDSAAAEDAERSLRILVAARNAMDSLALNELITRTRKTVEQSIEVLTNRVMDELKTARAEDREAALAAADAAIRFAAILFGEDYAAVLKKNRDMLVQKAGIRLVG